MAGTRAFDDGRWGDDEGFAECFICGKKIDPRDPSRGFYSEPPSGPDLAIHVPCAARIHPPRGMLKREVLSIEYHKALNQMVDRQYYVQFGRR